MISNAFETIAHQLEAYFRQSPSRAFSGSSMASSSSEEEGAPQASVISFLAQQDQQDIIKFPLNKVTPILINIEEENQTRFAERYSKVGVNGDRVYSYPDIRLNLFVLFVSNFQDYLDAMHYVGLTIKYFQSRPVFSHENAPKLNPETDKLIFELLTLPFAQQNEVWNALRCAYRPSVLYKVKMLVFQSDVTETAKKVDQIKYDLKNTTMEDVVEERQKKGNTLLKENT